MEKLATKVIDVKDDVSGNILKQIFPKYEDVPEVIKTASRQDPEDHEFALVMMNDGQKFRKFATHDAGNTALSVLYFLKTASELPIEAVKIAADNLINASGRFRLPIPEELKELAAGMPDKGIEVRTREKFWRPLDSLTRVGELDAGRVVEKTAVAIAAPMSLGKNMLRSAVGHGVIGGAVGAISNDEDRLKGFGQGALAGGVVGAGMGYAGTKLAPKVVPHVEKFLASPNVSDRTKLLASVGGLGAATVPTIVASNQAAKIAGAVADVARGGLIGGAIGAGTGAIANKKDRLHGAQMGALYGGTTGAIMGGAFEGTPIFTPAYMGYKGSKWNKEAQISATQIAHERGLIDATKEAKFRLPVGLVDDVVKRYPTVSKMTAKPDKGVEKCGGLFGGSNKMPNKTTMIDIAPHEFDGAYQSPEVQAIYKKHGRYDHPEVDKAVYGFINKMRDPNYNPPSKIASNVIDVSKLEVNHPSSEKTAKYTLLGQYPVDTFEQIKLAQEYFSDHWREFPPQIRHEYCVKLSQRAESLDVPTTNEVSRYGSETYSSDLGMHLNQRKDFVPEEYHDLLDRLEKKASVVGPEVFAEALGAFDSYLGIDRFWDSKLADPYRATFGPSHQKLAEKEWNFTEMGLYINEQDLKTLAYQHIEKVRKQFGQAFAAKFVGNPKGVFEKQDRETKILLARMASHDY